MADSKYALRNVLTAPAHRLPVPVCLRLLASELAPSSDGLSTPFGCRLYHPQAVGNEPFHRPNLQKFETPQHRETLRSDCRLP